MSAHEMHAGHDDHHAEEAIHVTTGGYVTGFILAVILTVIPFWLVMGDVIENRGTAAMVLGLFAAVQVLVHMYFFLHMNGKMEGGWTMLSTIFAVVFVAITLMGTLWVMFHMNANMMPAHTDLPALHQHVGEAAGESLPAAVQPDAATPAVVQSEAVEAVEASEAAPAEQEGAEPAGHGAHGHN